MLSQEERQELAENAMEELASGLNRAAQAMKVSLDLSVYLSVNTCVYLS